MVEAFFVKKAAMLQKAVTVNELKEIMKPNATRYVAGKVVASGNLYDVEEEELILWSITSLNSPLIDEAYKRI